MIQIKYKRSNIKEDILYLLSNQLKCKKSIDKIHNLIDNNNVRK